MEVSSSEEAGAEGRERLLDRPAERAEALDLALGRLDDIDTDLRLSALNSTPEVWP